MSIWNIKVVLWLTDKFNTANENRPTHQIAIHWLHACFTLLQRPLLLQSGKVLLMNVSLFSKGLQFDCMILMPYCWCHLPHPFPLTLIVTPNSRLLEFKVYGTYSGSGLYNYKSDVLSISELYSSETNSFGKSGIQQRIQFHGESWSSSLAHPSGPETGFLTLPFGFLDHRVGELLNRKKNSAYRFRLAFSTTVSENY